MLGACSVKGSRTVGDSARTLVCMGSTVVTEWETPGFIVLFRELKHILYKAKTLQRESSMTLKISCHPILCLFSTLHNKSAWFRRHFWIVSIRNTHEWRIYKHCRYFQFSNDVTGAFPHWGEFVGDWLEQSFQIGT